MRKLVLALCFLSLPVFANVDGKVAEISRRRLELEQLNTDYQAQLSRLNQEKEILRDKIQDAKNAQLKERLKVLQLQQQVETFKNSFKPDLKSLKVSTTKSEFYSFHKEVSAIIALFLQGTYAKGTWQELSQELNELHRRGQYAAYQVKLSQIMEKLIFESNQVSFGFETILIDGVAKSFEVMRLGHWLVVAKDPNGYWAYKQGQGFKKISSSQGDVLFKILPLVKAQSLHFVPQDIIDFKASEASL